MDTEMSEDIDHNLTPTLDSMSYGMPNQTGSENSLLDEDDYFLNSGDLAGIPVVGSDNEDEPVHTGARAGAWGLESNPTVRTAIDCREMV